MEQSPARDGKPPRFACDAMLRGLARWLRAWGYDATWRYGIGDRELLAEARAQGRVVLTADSGILARRRVREGDPVAVAVPHDAPPLEQLRVVVRRLGLPRLPGRCMGCGGALERVPKADVAGEAPPRTYAWLEEFYRCRRCRGLFWKGTHWQRIQDRLALLVGAEGLARDSPGAPAESDDREP